MTTYTVTEDQLFEVMDALLLPSMKTEAMLRQKDKAYVMLQSLQPNTQEAVAEVLWYDPMLYDPETNPYKRIDAPMSFMESAPLGTKLYTHPAPQAKPLTDEQLRKAAQAVVDRWDTPLWKDVPATANYINELREALK